MDLIHSITTSSLIMYVHVCYFSYTEILGNSLMAKPLARAACRVRVHGAIGAFRCLGVVALCTGIINIPHASTPWFRAWRSQCILLWRKKGNRAKSGLKA